MKILKRLLFGLLLLLILSVSVKNAGNVRFRYFGLIDSFEIPLFLVLLLSGLLGTFTGAIVGSINRYRLEKTIRRQREIMGKLQAEVSSLRNLTFSGSNDEGNNRVRRARGNWV